MICKLPGGRELVISVVPARKPVTEAYIESGTEFEQVREMPEGTFFVPRAVSAEAFERLRKFYEAAWRDGNNSKKMSGTYHKVTRCHSEIKDIFGIKVEKKNAKQTDTPANS